MMRYFPRSRRELLEMQREIEAKIVELNSEIMRERLRIKRLEEELREARRRERKLAEERRRLKKELEKLRRRYYNFWQQTRKWALKNPGKVLETLTRTNS